MKNKFENIVADALESLFEKRIIFHSEADFQHALAMTIAENNNIKIRLEKPCKIDIELTANDGEKEVDKDIKIDIELTANDGEKDLKYAIELKYKTKELNCVYLGENFNLKAHSDRNLGRYDFWKDCERITKLEETFCGGCVIFLTNDVLYKKTRDELDCMSKNFAIEETSLNADKLEWMSGKGEYVIEIDTLEEDEKEAFKKSVGKFRTSPITFCKTKTISLDAWKEPQKEDLDNHKNNKFYYIIAKIAKI